jgi:hypothetical protein
VEQGKELGGQDGYLAFSVDPGTGESTGNMVLFTSDGNALSETPRSSMGSIVPILYVNLWISGLYIDSLLGGFSTTVFDWAEDSELIIYDFPDSTFREALDAEKVVISMLAYDFDAYLTGDGSQGVDVVVFQVDTGTGTTDPATTPAPAPTPEGSGVTPQGSGVTPQGTSTTSAAVSTQSLSVISFSMFLAGLLFS